VRVHDFVDKELFFLHGLGFGLRLFLSSLLLLFLTGLLLFFLLASVTLNLLLEGHFDLDLIVFLKVLGHRDLDD